MCESSSDSVPQHLSNQSKDCFCPKVRKIGSKGAVLVIVWTHLAYASFGRLFSERAAHLHSDSVSEDFSVGFGVVTLLGPLAGLVASSYFGRYKTLYASLWIMWIGSIAIAAILVLHSVLPDSDAQQIVAFSGVVIAEVVYFIGFTGFSVNSVPFGLDQMPDASGDQICAFIHWHVWSMLAGLATAAVAPTINNCLDISSTTVHHYQSLVSAVLLTVLLCSIFLLRRWLIIEPEGTNPLKNVFTVLRFAARHKTPVRRSAFTYWEAGIPSRIDLAKSKYGGPFTNEEVEDVKTCLRMVVVISTTIVILATFMATYSGFFDTITAMFIYSQHYCHVRTLRLILYIASCVIFSPPVYATALHPLIKRCMPTTLKRAGMAHTLAICASFIMLVVSIVWYTRYSPTECVLTSKDNVIRFSTDYRWVAAPLYLIIGTFLFLYLMAMLEFVCAQAPYNLRGLLVGLVHSALLLSIPLGFAIYLIWKTGYQHSETSSPSCGVWFYLFTTITATLSCVLWCAVAKWYKRRERDEPEMCHIFAENYYDH